MTRRSLLLSTLLAAALLGGAGTAPAQTPAKPIRIIVPYAPGGPIDVTARQLAERVKDSLGPVIIENRPGAGGNIGADAVAKAAPDGLTLGIAAVATHAINPWLFGKMPYNAATDFAPITQWVRVPNVLVMNADTAARLKINSLADLIAYGKAHPGQLNYATSGNGTIVHLNSLAFAAQAGVQLTHVPYKRTAQSITDLAAGQVHLLFDSIPTGLPHVTSGRLRALAVTGEQRSALAPNLPTLAESGLPGYASVTWFGVYGPAGMKPELVSRINQAFNQALQNPEVVASLARQGVDAAKPQTAAQFAAMVQADSARWAKVIKDNRIALD